MREIAPNMPDYETAYLNDRLEVPEFFNFGFDVVDRWAEDRTKLALLSADPSGEIVRHHSFWDLKVLSDKCANAAPAYCRKNFEGEIAALEAERNQAGATTGDSPLWTPESRSGLTLAGINEGNRPQH